MKKRVLSVILALSIVGGILSGCGSSKEGDSTKNDGEITITVATRYSNENPDENYYRQKVEEFNALDNGITVKMDNIATEADYLDKLRTSFANGDTPNIFLEYGGSRCLDYLEADALVDLRSYLEENDSEWYDTFYDSLWGQTQYEGYDGIYAVPFKTYMVVLYYNKQLFTDNNIKVPESVDDMLAVCEQFNALGIKPFQVGEKDTYRFGHFNNNLVIKTLGVEAVDQLANRELAYDSEEMLSTYRTMQTMVEKGYFGENILDTDSTAENTMFEEGNVAMHYDGTWYLANNLMGTDFYDNVGVTAFPYGSKDCSTYAQGGASDMLFVSQLNKSDEEIAASVEFLKYITSQEYFQGLDEKAQTLFPVKFDKTDASPENPLLDDVVALQSQVTDMRTDIQNYDPASHMLDTVRSALQGLAMGNTAEECGQAIVDRMDEYGE